MSKQHEAIERPLPERIARARQEGRTQHALDLTRQLFKHNQTEENRELLRQVTLERGKQLQAEGKINDAATVFSHLLTMGGAQELRAEATQCLASCGAAPQALASLPQLEDPALRQRVLQQAADAAIAKGATGKHALPAELHAGFDLVLHAFKHYEAGRDEEARAALQGIGLQSPFLEWKLLLRGLLAYHADPNDDARALENWRRLDPNRLPHRLCAALRAGIDPDFLKAQPAAVQKSLQAKIAAQQGSAFAAPLRELGVKIQHENLAPAFRKAETLVKNLGRDFPQIVPRLGHCFFWAILDHGQPEDLERYLRVFGRPADDPELYRLEALALEMRAMWPEAHKTWQNFVEHVAKSPREWPGEIGTRVQAMIWSRMAENAMSNRRRRGKSANPFFDLFADQTAPLKPTSEQCYEKAIALAPDRLAGYIPLFELYRRGGKLAKAKKLGQQMHKRFPDRADTLEALGELCLETKDYKKAQEYFEKSIQANPLDLTLRGKLARARQKFGLKLTLENKYELARAQYEKALHLWDGAKTPLLCQWAIAELKAGNTPRADELIARSLAEPDQRLACRYALVGESVRAGLPPKQKKQIGDDLKAALAQTPSPAEILVLLESAAAQRQIHDEAFHGQKTQEKTILKFLDAIQFNAFNEEQLQRLAAGLETLNARKPWFRCLNHARRHHLKNPSFRLSFVDYYLMGGDSQSHLAEEHLDAARRLVEAMPRGEQQERYLDEIKEKEAFIAELKSRHPSMMDVLDRIMGGFGPDMDDDDYDGGEHPW
jgi:tetratricopeptide (TPR) repeat protein